MIMDKKMVGIGGACVKGGEGSGNFSHAGRPGEVGGSSTDSGGKFPSRTEQIASIEGIKSQLRQYNQIRGERTTPEGKKIMSSERIVLDHGKEFYFDKTTFEGPRGTAKECFRNATLAVLENPDLTYVEGYADIGPFAIEHAWTVDEAGKVVDPTFRLGKGNITVKGYYGVPFTTDYVQNTVTKTGYYGIISYTNSSIYTEGLDSSVIKEFKKEKGGEGSGNFGHAGRPGEVGGSGAGGGGEHPGQGYTSNAYIDNKGVIHTDNVNDAARALFEDRKVELNQPEQVSVLLKELAQYGREAELRGEKARNYNLCNVSVQGTNLFCADSMGVPRVQMPQLKGIPMEGSRAASFPPDKRGEVDVTDQFKAHLEGKGIKVEYLSLRADYLKATQNELNGVKTGQIAQAIRENKLDKQILFVSKDNYIVDGHHRWAATVAVDFDDNRSGDLKMDVGRIDMPIIDILNEAKDFAKDWGIPQVSAKGYGCLSGTCGIEKDKKGRWKRMGAEKGQVKTTDFEVQQFKVAKNTDPEGQRIIEGYFTTADIDRTGDVSMPSAFEKTMVEYMKNPVVAYMHDWKKAIGKVVDYKIDGKGVWIQAEIAKGVGWIDELWTLIQQGVLKGFSFGYKTLKNKPLEVEGKKVNQLLEIELFEISVVSIPMNASALFTLAPAGGIKSVMVRRGEEDIQPFPQVSEVRFHSDHFTEDQARGWVKANFKGTLVPDSGTWYADEDSFVFKSAFPLPYGGKKDTVTTSEGVALVFDALKGKEEEKSATIFGNLPLADRDAPWSFSVEDGNALLGEEGSDWDAYRKAHFWYDSDNAETKVGYKLPFAKLINGSLVAFPRGIIAAAAAIQGARGGVDIPSKDVEAVQAHIARYYKKMEMETPWEKGMTKEEVEKEMEEADKGQEKTGKKGVIQDSLDKKKDTNLLHMAFYEMTDRLEKIDLTDEKEAKIQADALLTEFTEIVGPRLVGYIIARQAERAAMREMMEQCPGGALIEVATALEDSTKKLKGLLGKGDLKSKEEEEEVKKENERAKAIKEEEERNNKVITEGIQEVMKNIQSVLPLITKH